jgi:hypothetical protein
MSSPRADWTRREALRLLAAAGLTPFAFGGGGIAACSDAPPPPGPDSLIRDPAEMARIGALWLAGQAVPPRTEELVRALSATDPRDRDHAALRERLGRRQRGDWIEGRVEEVRGFRFARTELELYALAERLRSGDGRAGRGQS